MKKKAAPRKKPAKRKGVKARGTMAADSQRRRARKVGKWSGGASRGGESEAKAKPEPDAARASEARGGRGDTARSA